MSGGVRALVALVALVAACSRTESAAPTARAIDASPVATPPPSADDAAPPRAAAEDAPAVEPPAPVHPPVRQGAALALSPAGDALYVAGEEHGVLRIVSVPRAGGAPVVRAIPMPGPPANVLVLGDRVLVTVRDPGRLVVLRPDPDAGLVESAHADLPADAWGLAASADGATAYVTSAWSHAVSAVDVASGRRLWTVDVAREPRGIVAHPSGAIYVSHLTSAALTRIDAGGGAPVAKRVALPAAPLRAARGKTLEASLGWSLALAPEEGRLFAPRHALGALGRLAWYGAATVDVLAVPADAPLAPSRAEELVETHPPVPDVTPPMTYPEDPLLDGDAGALPATAVDPFVQPRAAVYRASTRTLLVAGEGDEVLAELDALAIDPALRPVRTIALSSNARCGAPSGIALSADEQVAYVACRTTFNVLAVPLGERTKAPIVSYAVAADPLDAAAAKGRVLFASARERTISGGLACAGCHPEGRDDGHVWHEIATDGPNAPAGARSALQRRIFVGSEDVAGVGGAPRQTPMLAGRLRAAGPYGWLAESPDLAARITAGVGLHRWLRAEAPPAPADVAALVEFARRGLVPPPRARHPLGAIELRGKALFEQKEVGCATCHVPDGDFALGAAVRLPKLPRLAGFDDEDAPFKVPSLLFVGGTAPYLHDGRAATLADLLATNGDRMGHTAKLTDDDRAALAAYLETL